MIKTTAMLLEELKQYKNPACKLARMVKNGDCIPVTKGLYETERTTPGYLLAGSIYGPSYLSFDYALAYYGLIPEAVYHYTSATFEKKKKKTYHTPFGVFTYRDVPSAAYPYGIAIRREGDYAYQIATPEKALCDKLYTMAPAANQKLFYAMLFEDLRLDWDEWEKLSAEEVGQLSELYHCTNVKYLYALMRR